jgi:hypothetical protein
LRNVTSLHSPAGPLTAPARGFPAMDPNKVFSSSAERDRPRIRIIIHTESFCFKIAVYLELVGLSSFFPYKF